MVSSVHCVFCRCKMRSFGVCGWALTLLHCIWLILMPRCCARGCFSTKAIACDEYLKGMEQELGSNGTLHLINASMGNADGCYVYVDALCEYGKAKDVCRAQFGDKDGGFIAPHNPQDAMTQTLLGFARNKSSNGGVEAVWVGLERKGGAWKWVCNDGHEDDATNLQWVGQPAADNTAVLLLNSTANDQYYMTAANTHTARFFCQLNPQKMSATPSVSTTAPGEVLENTNENKVHKKYWENICVDMHQECYVLVAGWTVAGVLLVLMIVLVLMLISANGRIKEAEKQVENCVAKLKTLADQQKTAGGASASGGSLRMPGGSMRGNLALGTGGSSLRGPISGSLRGGKMNTPLPMPTK